MYVKVIENQRWDVFLRQCILSISQLVQLNFCIKLHPKQVLQWFMHSVMNFQEHHN